MTASLKLWSKNQTLVATVNPSEPDQVLIMGIAGPLKGIILAQLIPDPTYPEHGDKPFGILFPPNPLKHGGPLTYEQIRKAFGLTLETIWMKLKDKTQEKWRS